MTAWRSTFAHSDVNDNESSDSGYEDEGWSPEQRKNSSDTTESDLVELSSVATAKSKSSTSRKPGRKAVWRETVKTDIWSTSFVRVNISEKNLYSETPHVRGTRHSIRMS